MNNREIVFVVVEEYDNLGAGYLSAILKPKGFNCHYINVRARVTASLKAIREIDPFIIGFSVIFHHYLSYYIRLAEYLRKKNIICHFTAGGHYASLQPVELFDRMPQLDSIVRFEGEKTMTELAQRLSGSLGWTSLKGLSYRDLNGKVIHNPHRAFVKDIDVFPFPVRPSIKEFPFGKRFTTIIAGRGCVHNCSFCNTRKFYSQSAYSIKRVRSPEKVVNEMAELYRNHLCGIFFFLDDDFPVKWRGNNMWILKFCSELTKQGLKGKVTWKISCRPDEVEESVFSLMKEHGLFSVFLGIEDGTPEGLIRMNKKLQPQDSLNAIAVLKKLKIRFDYGFMLFHPYTTFDSLRKNIDYIERICADGYTPASFLRMIPFYCTKLAEDLCVEERLKTSQKGLSYKFPEKSMDRYYSFVMKCFYAWLRTSDGLYNNTRIIIDQTEVFRFYWNDDPILQPLISKINKIAEESNAFILSVLRRLIPVFEGKTERKENAVLLAQIYKRVKEYHYYFNYWISAYSEELCTRGQKLLIEEYTGLIRTMAGSE